jgi:fatty acid desaturase
MVSALWLSPIGYYMGFRYIHLEHHAYTNDPDRDPDMYASLNGIGGPKFLFLRWCTIDIHYIMKYSKYVLYNFKVKEITYYVAYAAFLIGLWKIIYTTDYIMEYILFSVISTRISLFLLSFAFDFLPHYPHEITRQLDKYKTTSYISISDMFRPLLSLMFMYQNFHISHHLNPSYPFYLYGTVWFNNKETLIKDHNISIKKFIAFPEEEKIL